MRQIGYHIMIVFTFLSTQDSRYLTKPFQTSFTIFKPVQVNDTLNTF